jgi:TRAP-type mannitol/chloroaromatic compound transport system substrate-binding protein
MERREFLRGSGAGVAAAGLLATPAWAQAKTYSWKLVTSWPPKFPIYIDGLERMARLIDQQSGGRMKIQVYGAGELVPAFGVFDAVSQGTVEMGHSFAAFWAGKVPAAQFFASVPFGFNAQQFNTWVTAGDGLKLWEDLYRPHNLVPFPAGNTGVTAAGWFKRKISSAADLKGLKMRITGLGGKVLAKAGGTIVLLAPGEIYTSLERGVVDAAEFIGPVHDVRLGFHNAARHYYWPGWHEPAACNELMINARAWDGLSEDLRAIVRAAVSDYDHWALAQFEAQNAQVLAQLAANPKVEILSLPDDVLRELRKLSRATLEEEAAKDPAVKRVYEAYLQFGARMEPWSKVTEEAYLRALRL